MSTIFGIFILLIGLSVLANREPPLPKRLVERVYPSSKLKLVLERGLVWVRRIEKISRPRFLFITEGYLMERLNGLLLVIGALLLMAPLPMFPFSNTLPGLAILFVAIGMLQKDGICVLLGCVSLVATCVYFTILAGGTAMVLYKLWQLIAQLFGG